MLCIRRFHIFISRAKTIRPARRLAIFCFVLLMLVKSSAQPPDLKFRYISKEQGLSNSMVQCIYQDSQGFIWIGTSDGLNKYDGYKITSYHHTIDSNSISSSNILA